MRTLFRNVPSLLIWGIPLLLLALLRPDEYRAEGFGYIAASPQPRSGVVGVFGGRARGEGTRVRAIEKKAKKCRCCFALAISFARSLARSLAQSFSPRSIVIKQLFLASSSSAARPVTLDISRKYYQLEELEDKESCTTDVFLNSDRTVTVGETDGPVYLSASGTWSQDPSDGSFRMVLSRTYEAGREPHQFTDMGEFDFTVERVFTGEVTEVGSKLAVVGSIHDMDEAVGDKSVGFFNMIDTTKERLGEKDDDDL